MQSAAYIVQCRRRDAHAVTASIRTHVCAYTACDSVHSNRHSAYWSGDVVSVLNTLGADTIGLLTLILMPSLYRKQ